MSISTRKGDDGETSLLFGRRIRKTHPRVEAYGNVDELSCVLGLARATAAPQSPVADQILQIQKDLWIMGGELAVDDADAIKFTQSKFTPIEASHVAWLDAVVLEYEARTPPFKEFVQPGATLHSGYLHLGRTVCRRTERNILRLRETGQSVSPIIIQYINRLSDVLWLMAYEAERWDD